MKRKKIAFALLAVLIFCVSAYLFAVRLFLPFASFDTFAADPLMALVQENRESSISGQTMESVVAVSEGVTPNAFAPNAMQASSEQPSMESLMMEILGDGSASIHAVGDLVTQPERCVLLGSPHQMIFLQEENVALMNNAGGIYAFDIASGGQRWHRFVFSADGQHGTSFGQRQVLTWSDQGAFLLDAATGREKWSRHDTPCGKIQWAKMSPDETQVFAECKRGRMLFSVTDGGERVLPKKDNAWLSGWLPGNMLLLYE